MYHRNTKKAMYNRNTNMCVQRNHTLKTRDTKAVYNFKSLSESV